MTAPDAGLRLVAIALAWLSGTALQLQQAELWPPWAHAASAAVAAVTAPLAWRAAARRGASWPLLVVLGLLAFALTGTRAQWRLDERLAPELEGRDLRVTGVVASLPVGTPNAQQFRLEVEQAHALDDGTAVELPERIAVGWYLDGELLPGVVRAGERWRFTLRCRQPHGALNPHGFDRELWLFEQRVGATAYVRTAPAPERLDARAGLAVEPLRQRLRDAIFERIADPRIAGLLAALAVGDQSAIERDDWDLFRATGVAHLMSISGLHVTMFAWLAGIAIGAGWRRSERAMTAMPAQTAARWGGLACAAGYALLAGWGVPAQRTVLMLATVTLLRSAGVHWPWPPVLLAAAVVVGAVDPWALLQPGFWLSFAAIGLLLGSQPASEPHAGRPQPPPPHGIGWTMHGLGLHATGIASALASRTAAVAPRAAGALRGALRTQAVATLGLAPLTLVLFQQVSVVGFVANLVAIPVVTLLVVPLALAGVLLPPLWQAAAFVAQPLVAALSVAASLPGAVYATAAAPAWAQAAGLAAGALAVAPLPWRLRLLALPLALPLLVPAVDAPAHGRFELLAADVGQGSAVIVRTRGHLLVYDAGPAYRGDSDAGQRVLLPLLRASGARRIDVLLLSHGDADHVGGAAALLGALPVGELLHSLDDGHALLALHAAPRRCSAGDAWQWDGVQFELLHPPAAAAGVPPPAKPNARSCVLRVRGAQGSALLTGDIEAAQERALLERAADRLASDVLLVPHHGSRTSSSEPFLDAVLPRIAVVQAGYRNRFGHPAAPVLRRYASRGVALVRSDRCGAWRWRARDGAMLCQRDIARRYWHHRPEGSNRDAD